MEHEDHEGPEPRLRTLLLFGVGMAVVIVSIIVGAALLAG
jgi:hypothetical protein